MSNFGSLFEACGKFFLPGKQPLGDPLPPITSNYDPTGTGEIDPTLGEIIPPPGEPLFKCEERRVPCPFPNGNITERLVKTCVQCLNPDGTPLLSLITRPAGNEDCRFREPTCDDDPTAEPCVTMVFDCPGTPKRYKCQESYRYCPPRTTAQGLPLVPSDPTAIDPIRDLKQIIRTCVECAPQEANPDCIYTRPDCSDGPPCFPSEVRNCISRPLDPGGQGGGSTGPTTGAGFKCVTEKIFCPAGTPKAGTYIGINSRECKTCNRGDIPRAPVTNPGSFRPAVPDPNNPGNVIKPALVNPDTRTEETACQYPNVLATCKASCPPAAPITPPSIARFCLEEPQILAPITPDPGGTRFGRPLTPPPTGGPLGPTAPPPTPTLGRPITPNPGGTRFPGLPPSPPGPTTGPTTGRPLGPTAPEPSFPLGTINTIIPQADPSISVPGPSQSVNLPTQQLLQIQERNATFVNTNQQILKEDNEELKNLNFNQKLYHPELNFFKSEPDRTITLTSNNSYRDIFSDKVDITVNKALLLTNTSSVWNEKDFFNLTNEKIISSLNEDLLIAFKIIRFPGGEVVGLDTFVDSLRKHLVTGTISKFDPSFYIEVAKAQLQQNFTLLEPAATKEYASRFSIDYIVNNGESLLEDKTGAAKNIQVNRGRVLNEDLDMKINVQTILSGTQPITVPNEGVLLSALTAGSDTTPISVGKHDRLNTGDGGGYYFYISGVNDNVPLRTDNLLETSFYLPDFKKSKVLSLNGKSFVATIEASSLPDKHEFVSGDAGASSFEPMYFGINLSSVSSSYEDDPLIEKYTAAYSRIVDTDQIARHVNNNAQSFSEFRIGYDDPLYRYILDTSSFTLTQEDLTVYGFKDGYSSVNFNFPKNIPFAILILPVAGSKFNPLNAQSVLTTYKGDTFVRSLDFKPSIGSFIDKAQGTNLQRYNLYNRDGSTKIGLVEQGSVQSFGYDYDPSRFYNTLYDGSSYTSSIDAVSSFGISYLMTEVLDYLASSTTSKSITWFDVYRRMPFNRFSELFYTAPGGIFDDIKEGFRQGLKPDFVLKGRGDQESLLLPSDSRTIIEVGDRKDTSKEKLGR